MIRIDAHHHVWRLDRGDYDWLSPDMKIYRDYEADDLVPAVDAAHRWHDTRAKPRRPRPKRISC